MIQESLTHYAELYDKWPTNLVKGVRTTSAPLGGPVHVNDVLRLWIPEGNTFWSNAGAAPFSHGVSASGTMSGSQDGFGYFGGNYDGSDATKVPYNSSGPIASRYARLANGGRDSVRSGADRVPLPTNSFQIRDAAWGFNSSTPLPTTPGVHVNQVSGKLQGVYIEGNVEEMQLGVGGTQPAGSSTVAYGNNSWVKIELPIAGQRSIDANQAVTVLTVDDAAISLPSGTFVNGATITGPLTVPIGSTVIRRANGRFETYNSPVNGVIYTNGDIRDVWGVNKGRRTIAVSGDTTAGVAHDIIIGGKESDSDSDAVQTAAGSPLSFAAGQKGIVQYGATDANGDSILDAPSTSNNTLGLVGKNVLISRRLKNGGRWDTAHPQNNPLYIYATVLGGLSNGGGSYMVQDYDTGGGGWTYKYGSRIMVDAGAWGTTGGEGLVNGTTFFDAPASTNPPPYFPSKPTFVVKSYEEVPLSGESL